MNKPSRLHVFVYAVVVTALASILAAFFTEQPTISVDWLVAFAILASLAISSVLLAIKVTEGGSTTAVDFIPQLASIVLLGPFGSGCLVIAQQVVTEFYIQRKQLTKAFFNTSQLVIAVVVAGALYISFGGDVGLSDIDFAASFPPFVVAVFGYFFVNTTLAPYAISLSEHRPYIDVWRQFAGPIIILDLAASPFAYLLVYLYVELINPLVLLAAVIPLIVLRYSYGVNLELRRLNQDLLRVLIKTLEARDEYTSGHSLRVAEYSKRIAHALDIKHRRIRMIETAALLHDIGKIDLAYGEILRQTGPLTPAQRELIRAHPDKGVDIVKSVRSLDPQILDCIRHHHERLDGNGYPSGLVGEDIPLGARIIGVADSIDAMQTDRPYRAALSIDEVRLELERNSGTQFDPAVVKATFDAGILD